MRRADRPPPTATSAPTAGARPPVRDLTVELPLDAIVLTDARTGRPVAPGRLPAVHTLIRHRY
jgi:hypothetical protein